MAIPSLLALEHVGLFPGARGWIDLAVEQLRRAATSSRRSDNAARSLARRIGRTIPIVYGGAASARPRRCAGRPRSTRTQKSPAFIGTVPELTHNEVCGWGQYGDVTRQVFTLVLLRHDQEHPQLMRRFELVRKWTDEVVAGVEEVRAEGDGPLAQLFDLMFVGTVTSLELAARAGVDPGPIPVLDEIKAAMSQ